MATINVDADSERKAVVLARIGLQWAEDRFKTGTPYDAFMVDDVLSLCGIVANRDDAYLVCEVAHAHFKRLLRGEVLPES